MRLGVREKLSYRLNLVEAAVLSRGQTAEAAVP